MEQNELNEILAMHQKWLYDEESGERANLQDANLQDANLRGANFDFSCLPLWCGGLNFKIDERIAKQLMYHVINLMQHSKIDTSKLLKKEIYKWLSDSHLVTKHGLPILKEVEK